MNLIIVVPRLLPNRCPARDPDSEGEANCPGRVDGDDGLADARKPRLLNELDSLVAEKEADPRGLKRVDVKHPFPLEVGRLGREGQRPGPAGMAAGDALVVVLCSIEWREVAPVIAARVLRGTEVIVQGAFDFVREGRAASELKKL